MTRNVAERMGCLPPEGVGQKASLVVSDQVGGW